MTQLKSLPEYIEKFPENLTISEDKLIITETLNTANIHLTNGAKATIVALLTTGWTDEQFLKFHLQGNDCELNFIGLIIGKDKNTFPFQTESIHEVPNTRAYYYIRGVQFDQAFVKYRGCLIIKPGAQITDAYLGHHTLMLSKNAKVETIPSLEIEADDVKAGHAATLGRVDEETLHYMQSRGLDRRTAQDMLIKGFIEADLHRIPSESARIALMTAIEETLTGLISQKSF